MFNALATLGSWAIPKLVSFASKKLATTPVGQIATKVIDNEEFKRFGRETIDNIK